MNNKIISKAIDSGIDALTDAEYEQYTKYKSEQPPELNAIISKAVDNGIDALTDDEYDQYKTGGAEVSAPSISTPILDQAEQDRKSGAATPFQYDMTDDKGEVYDVVKTSKRYKPEEVKAEFEEMLKNDPNKSFTTSVIASNKGQLGDVNFTVTDDKDILDKWHIEQGDNTVMSSFFPRASASLMGKKDIGVEDIGKATLGTLGDVTSFPGRVAGSYAGAFGSDEPYMDAVARGIGDTGGNKNQNKLENTLQSIVRDPMAIPSMAVGGPAIGMMTKPISLGAQTTGQTAMIGSGLSKLSQLAKGAGVGTAQVAGNDLMNDYATDRDNIGVGSYALGGIGGAMIPQLAQGISKVTRGLQNIKPMPNIPQSTVTRPLPERVLQSDKLNLSHPNDIANAKAFLANKGLTIGPINSLTSQNRQLQNDLITANIERTYPIDPSLPSQANTAIGNFMDSKVAPLLSSLGNILKTPANIAIDAANDFGAPFNRLANASGKYFEPKANAWAFRMGDDLAHIGHGLSGSANAPLTQAWRENALDSTQYDPEHPNSLLTELVANKIGYGAPTAAKYLGKGAHLANKTLAHLVPKSVDRNPDDAEIKRRKEVVESNRKGKK